MALCLGGYQIPTSSMHATRDSRPTSTIIILNAGVTFLWGVFQIGPRILFILVCDVNAYSEIYLSDYNLDDNSTSFHYLGAPTVGRNNLKNIISTILPQLHIIFLYTKFLTEARAFSLDAQFYGVLRGRGRN